MIEKIARSKSFFGNKSKIKRKSSTKSYCGEVLEGKIKKHINAF